MLSPNAPLTAYLYPLSFEPGTHFRYSIGIDWAGFLVSRVTGLSLEEYFQKHIFEPSGIKHISFHPPADYEERKMGLLIRPVRDGDLMYTGKQPLPRTFLSAEIGPHYSGGGGLFGTARDYLRFLRAILASANPETSNPLISPASFKTLFTDTLPEEHRATMRSELVAMAERQNIHDPALLASGKGENIGHSPGLFLNYVESKYGRSAMSGCWDGAAKTMYWLDPAKGIAVGLTTATRHN
jgi:methyl acetate hydrolase